LKTLLDLYVCEQFVFNGNICKQVDGVALSSPLWPILADIFLSTLENKPEGDLNSTIPYRRYVDDTLVIARNETDIMALFYKLNSLHPDIKLTLECESGSKPPFYDFLPNRMSDVLCVCLFENRTHSRQRERNNTIVASPWCSQAQWCKKLADFGSAASPVTCTVLF
uniref:Reverse transcriptase domain-containing protein n=1 Tax=Echinostoma caproni TaxID=27848 RepID=A0A183B8J7_9TREM